MVLWTVAGPDVAEERASAVQGGGGDAQDATASQHCALLRLLRAGAGAWQASDRAGH